MPRAVLTGKEAVGTSNQAGKCREAVKCLEMAGSMSRAQREGVDGGVQAMKCREAVKGLEMAVSMLRAYQQGAEEARKYQAQLVQPAECGKPGGKWHDEVTEFVILAKANLPRLTTASPSTNHNGSKTIEMKTTYAHLDCRSVLYCTNCTNENENEN